MSLIIKLYLVIFPEIFPYWENIEMIVAGVMTGTSVDGIGWVYSFNFIEKTKKRSF